MGKNNFFRTLGHSISLPFVAMSLSSKYKSANKKAERYLNNEEEYSKEFRYNKVYKAVKKTMFIYNVDLEVRGLNNLMKRPMFIVPNHKSNMDPILLTKILYELKGYPYFNFVAKKELLDDKYASGLSKMLDTIYIDRNNPRDIIKTINSEIEALKENSVICFLEGTRINKKDELGEFKGAGLEPAYKTFAPIVPVAICGTYGVMIDNDKNRFKYKKIIVEFLEPIKQNKYLSVSQEYMAEQIKKRIEDAYKKLSEEIGLDKMEEIEIIEKEEPIKTETIEVKEEIIEVKVQEKKEAPKKAQSKKSPTKKTQQKKRPVKKAESKKEDVKKELTKKSPSKKEVKPKVINGIEEGKKHIKVNTSELEVYNYDKRRKQWKQNAGFNKEEVVCSVCKNKKHASILTSDNKHICYIDFIKKPTNKIKGKKNGTK